MRVNLIQLVVHIVVTRMIEAGIDGVSRGGNLVGMIRGLNTIQFIPLYQGADEIPNGV